MKTYQSQVPADWILLSINAADFPQQLITQPPPVIFLVITGRRLVLLISPEPGEDGGRETEKERGGDRESQLGLRLFHVGLLICMPTLTQPVRSAVLHGLSFCQ